MKDGSRQLNVTKMARTLRHPFTTRLTLEVPVDGAHTWIHKPPSLRLVRGLIHNFWVFDFGDGVSFLWRPSDRVNTKIAALTISSGERIPNCTSLTLRIGAAE